MQNENARLYIVRFPMFGGSDQMVWATQLDDTRLRLETTPHDADGQILAGDEIAVRMAAEGLAATFLRVVNPFPTQQHSFAVKPAALTSDGYRAFEAQVQAEGGHCVQVKGGDGKPDAETMHVTLPRASRLDVLAALETIGAVSQYDSGLATPPLPPSASVEEILDVLRIATSVFQREWRVAVGCMCIGVGTALLTAGKTLAACVPVLKRATRRTSATKPLRFTKMDHEKIQLAIEALEKVQRWRPEHLIHLTDYVRAIKRLAAVCRKGEPDDLT